MTHPHKPLASRLTAFALLAATLTSAGCYKTANPEPFAPQATNVEVEDGALAAVAIVGNALGTLADLVSSEQGPAPKDHIRLIADEQADPDDRRQAIQGLVETPLGKSEPAATAYAVVARDPNEPTPVRVTAIRAINRARAEGQTQALIELLQDENVRVRLEAAKALNRLPDEQAIPALLSVASDEEQDVDVRIAAVDALSAYDTPDVRRALVDLVTSRQFSVAWQARRSLVTLTQADGGYDATAWRKILEQTPPSTQPVVG